MHRSCCIQRKRRRRDKTCQTDSLHNSRDTRNLFACLRMLRSCMSARMREKKREREREGNEREREKKGELRTASLLHELAWRTGVSDKKIKILRGSQSWSHFEKRKLTSVFLYCSSFLAWFGRLLFDSPSNFLSLDGASRWPPAFSFLLYATPLLPLPPPRRCWWTQERPQSEAASSAASVLKKSGKV